MVPPNKILPEFLHLWNKDSSPEVKKRRNLFRPLDCLHAYVKWILNLVQEMCVRTDPQRSWLHPTNSLKFSQICFGPWTVCMREMDLELCTRDGCKNWPTKELVPPNKFSSWVSWSVKQRLVFQIVKKKNFSAALGLSACVEWILNFVQEMGVHVRTDLPRSWFHPTNYLPEFLDLWWKDWPSKI